MSAAIGPSPLLDAAPRPVLRPVRTWPGHPALLLILALAIHAAGRIAALCNEVRVDSFVYSVTAYKLHDADPRYDDLIPDKPPGQPLLTGWIYRVMPGPPSRLTLLPIESAWMIAAYTMFFLLCRRLWEATRAAWLTVILVIAQNLYNALDLTTDGFNLGENYIPLPTLLAAYAHLAVPSPGRRGLLRGVGLGLALSIKQTALIALLAMLADGVWRSLRHGQFRPALRSSVGTLVGLALGVAPVVIYLQSHGWLWDHLSDLRQYGRGHVAWMGLEWPPWYNIAPLCVLLWWMAVRLMLSAGPRTQQSSAIRGRPSILCFSLLWLLAESALVGAMTKPSTHYYQAVVIPALLLGGALLSGLDRRVERLALIERRRAGRWLAAASAGLIAYAALPLLAESAKRVRLFDPERERTEFAYWLAHWSPGDGALYKPSEPSGPQSP